MEKVIDGVYDDFEVLCQILRIMKEDGDFLVIGFFNQIVKIKFLFIVYMLYVVFFVFVYLSKVFQEGNVLFVVIGLVVKYIVDILQGVVLVNKIFGRF